MSDMCQDADTPTRDRDTVPSDLVVPVIVTVHRFGLSGPFVEAGPWSASLRVPRGPYRTVQHIEVPHLVIPNEQVVIELANLAPTTAHGWAAGSMRLSNACGLPRTQQVPCAIYTNPSDIGSSTYFMESPDGFAYAVSIRVRH